MTDDELDDFIRRVEEAINCDLNLEKFYLSIFLKAFKAFLFLQKISKNDLPILKMKKLLGKVSSSERLKKLTQGDKEDSGSQDQNEPSSTYKPPSNGKKPKDDFSKKDTIIIPIEPDAKGSNFSEYLSKLNKYQPREFVRITGNQTTWLDMI